MRGIETAAGTPLPFLIRRIPVGGEPFPEGKIVMGGEPLTHSEFLYEWQLQWDKSDSDTERII
jgi:hypothetical protein